MARFANNGKLLNAINAQRNTESIKAAASVPDYDAKNIQGYKAYSIEDKLKLVSMLNTLKLEPQYYRSENQQVKELQNLIEKIASKSDEDAEWVAKAIVYSRCKGEGLRSVNHLAAAILSIFIQGKPYARKFYSIWNKKKQVGGCIFRPDDMSEIQIAYKALHRNQSPLSNAMKRGFADAIISLDNYSIGKYKKSIIDITRLTHPNVSKSSAVVDIDGKTYPTVYALLGGMKIPNNTWENAQTEAGQTVAEAVKSGKITKEKGEQLLKEQKADNWRQLLDEGTLGILAALRNLRSMLLTGNDEIIDKVCKLISNKNKLIEGKIMPYQIDIAHEVIKNEFGHTANYRKLASALDDGIENSVSNLKDVFTGRNLIAIDVSGSMGGGWCGQLLDSNGKSYGTASSPIDKAALVSAMLAKSVNADVVRFENRAYFVTYNPKDSVFNLSEQFKRGIGGGTNMSSVFRLINDARKAYDRIFIISDNECNCGNIRYEYQNYIRNVADPYVYLVDLASYGTKPMDSDKVNYVSGYGLKMFDIIKQTEFNPNAVMSEIDKIKFE